MACCQPCLLDRRCNPCPRLQAALELQLKYSSSASQLAQLQPAVEEQQRLLSRWEARLGRQLEAIVGMQKTALSARSSGGGKTASGAANSGTLRAALGENSPMQTPSVGLPFRPAGSL